MGAACERSLRARLLVAENHALGCVPSKRSAERLIPTVERELREAATRRATQLNLRAANIPELLTELRQRLTRIQHLEAQLAAARRTPAEAAELMKRVEASARDRLADLRATLSDRGDLREVFRALFPQGLEFIPDRTEDGARQIWRIKGAANLGVIGDADLVPIESRPQRDSNPCYLRERRVS